MITELLKPLCGLVLVSPLIGAILAGMFADRVGSSGAHTLTIAGVSMSFICTLIIMHSYLIMDAKVVDLTFFYWIKTSLVTFKIGVWLDKLTVIMMFIVTSISLLVHIYSIGYMKGDPGYQRFFSYVSLFTFAMLSLVMANNFLQIFFGWEGVGLVSYLLIGFWHHKNSAAVGSFKAFLVNRVGDVGLLLGIAMILKVLGSLNFVDLFKNVDAFAVGFMNVPLLGKVSYAECTAGLLFIGAMGKSAQMPLHVWLPESMEGPTPISALIHAATMVTAGVYLLARLSPLYELAPSVLSMVLIIGASGALMLGLVGLVQHDIKRIIAYSTLSQLGYMMAACGVSAYHFAIFHLLTHAFFKALLFLGAGSVILACHHEQDIRKMGGLMKRMPITAITFLIGSLSLSAVPFFAGFYSKDAIIEVVGLSTKFGSEYSAICLTLGALVTAAYIFRAFFLVFIAPSAGHYDDAEEVSASVWAPLIILAIPSCCIAWGVAGVMLDIHWYKGAIQVLPKYEPAFNALAHHYVHPFQTALMAWKHIPFWLVLLGISMTYYLSVVNQKVGDKLKSLLSPGVYILEQKWFFDRFNESVIVPFVQACSQILSLWGDQKIIDSWVVHGSGRVVASISERCKVLQTGKVYHYVYVMMVFACAWVLSLIWF
ncbi:MAG TPA: NADH-quinone oxidoreductase subunit L [Gammaproteobacteria bacterium]|nr:NADH-quinone oxidoreductase subunit L [Gammaproteobacteria bacterium]